MKFALSTLLWATLLACGSTQPTEAPSPQPAAQDDSALDSAKSADQRWSPEQAIDEAAAYLLRHLGPDGRFDYLRRSKKSEVDYNVLRHAGSIYSMLQYYERKPSAELKAGILRAASYLKSRYIRAPKKKADLLAVFSRPDEESVEVSTAKLGGAALALIALSGAHRLDPATISRAELSALASFIAFMQKKDGGFHSKYTEKGGFDARFHSLYYPGEAMLSLSKLYDIDGDTRWLEVALRSAAQLVKSRQGTTNWPADHWMMLSSAPLLARYEALQEPPISAASFAEHITQLGTLIMDDQDPEVGSFARKRRSTPAATRLEGLTALLETQDAKGQRDPRLVASITRGLAFLMNCQIRDESSERGGMPRNCEDAGKKRDGEVRIDYVQHYLSAMLAADALGLLSE